MVAFEKVVEKWPKTEFGAQARSEACAIYWRLGKTEKWLVGGPAIIRMEANGWTKTSVKVGDVITGIGYQFANGEKVLRLERVVLPDGKELRLYGK